MADDSLGDGTFGVVADGDRCAATVPADRVRGRAGRLGCVLLLHSRRDYRGTVIVQSIARRCRGRRLMRRPRRRWKRRFGEADDGIGFEVRVPSTEAEFDLSAMPDILAPTLAVRPSLPTPMTSRYRLRAPPRDRPAGGDRHRAPPLRHPRRGTRRWIRRPPRPIPSCARIETYGDHHGDGFSISSAFACRESEIAGAECVARSRASSSALTPSASRVAARWVNRH